MDRAVAEAVLERAAGHCECCGWPALDLVLHHRKLRSHGGPDEPANLLAIHPQCHTYVHAYPLVSITYGFIVTSGRDPATEPVQLIRAQRTERITWTP